MKMISTQTKSKRLALISVVLFSLIGAGYVIFSKAQLGNYFVESVISYAPGSDGNYNAGDTLEAWVAGSFENSNRTGQLRVVAFSNPEWVDYLRYECAPNVKCYESGWDNPTATYTGRKDLKLCVSMPVSGWQAGQQNPHIFSIFYKVRSPATSAFHVQLEDGNGNGTCEENPMASGVIHNGGSGACYNNRFTGCAGNEVGYLNWNQQGFGPGFGIKLTGEQQGQSTTTTTQQGQAASQQKNSTSGGSSAKKQSEQQNNTPTSSAQGDNKQTKLEPSPFFDGKDFKPGSDADTTGSIDKIGKRLATKWIFIVPLVAFGLLAVAALWWWKKKKVRQ